MRIICAPDSFKESLSAFSAAKAMRRGVLKALPTASVDCCPIADGGEGTVDAMIHATGGTFHEAEVAGPLGTRVRARWGMLGEGAAEASTAVIEMAEASGLHLVPADHRDPTRTTTYGAGQLIAAALDAGAERIILGIGGSATNDGGCGAAQALGVRFFGDAGRLITEPMCGGHLGQLVRIDAGRIDPRVAACEIVAACDVTNPLVGDHGAAAVYAWQKGATAEQVADLDGGLRHYARLVAEELGVEIAELSGAGAAGGLGGGVVGLLGGQLRRGVQLVLDAVQFSSRAAGADLCLTGEGKLDDQSLSGKAIMGVARAAAPLGVPTVALVGSIGDGAHRALEAGLSDYRQIGEGRTKTERMRNAATLLEEAAAEYIAESVADARRPQGDD